MSRSRLITLICKKKKKSNSNVYVKTKYSIYYINSNKDSKNNDDLPVTPPLM